MLHPFLKLSSQQRRFLFWTALGSTALAAAVLQYLDAPLKTTAAPLGIVSFELAGTQKQVQAILVSWDSYARLHAAFSLGFDYLFMLLYTTTIALGLIWQTERVSTLGKRLGVGLAWSMGIAGIADATENVLLWKILLERAPDFFPPLARIAAITKFVLIILALFYLLASLMIQAITKGQFHGATPRSDNQ